MNILDLGMIFIVAVGAALLGAVWAPGTTQFAESPGGVGVVEFRSTDQYSDWLHRNGDQLTIISVNTTKRWGILTGFFGGAKTITVTYTKNKVINS